MKTPNKEEGKEVTQEKEKQLKRTAYLQFVAKRDVDLWGCLRTNVQHPWLK